ncbi:MAG: HypC/HybG/HupF family hydrogenase formation chaperone [Pirellulales bacterium]
MCLAIPGQLVELPATDGPFREALVDFSGTRRRVNLACTPDAQPGDYVLVHAGIAIAVLDPEEAHRTLEILAQLQLGDDEDDRHEIRR